nr:hypothetical protein [Bacillus toyonensis]
MYEGRANVGSSFFIYVTTMTNYNKEVVATHEYDAWGNVLKSEAKGIAADSPFGYAG